MFLNRLIENNRSLIKYAFDLHKEGLILPDTYVLDLDQIVENGKIMKEEADKYGIDLYFMLKQIGRNPEVAKALMEVGFKGAVTVDYKEALCMIDNNIHICNVGHLVQVPNAALARIVAAKPDYITVYSYDKILQINDMASKYHRIQKLLIRLSDEDSNLYSGQEAGFNTKELSSLLDKIEKLENVEFGGITVFPALLFDSDKKEIVPTDNIKAINRGINILNKKGYKDYNINLPSATCKASMSLIHKLKGNSGEPGHGLTGTTPLHKESAQEEKVAYIYVSEISHNYLDKAYCYGGGHYRRSHMENALVGSSFNNMEFDRVVPPSDESIDYHFELEHNHNVGDTVLMAFRTQIFTTRSHVAVVKGISENKPQIIGIYDGFGKKVGKNW